MKKIIFAMLLVVATSIGCTQEKGSFYDYKVEDIDGKEFDMSSLKGKKVLVVNVASQCVRTPQYKQLQELYTRYKDDKDFVVVGFPANDFKGQEPGSNDEIKEFCSQIYSVTFPMMGKVSVKGDAKAPIYKWLTEKEMNGKLDAEVISNFQKFMIDRDGSVVDFVSPDKDPFTEKIVEWIEQ